MGWWGYGIMEGDTPCDCRYDILRAAADKDAVEALVLVLTNTMLWNR